MPTPHFREEVNSHTKLFVRGHVPLLARHENHRHACQLVPDWQGQVTSYNYSGSLHEPLRVCVAQSDVFTRHSIILCNNSLCKPFLILGTDCARSGFLGRQDSHLSFQSPSCYDRLRYRRVPGQVGHRNRIQADRAHTGQDHKQEQDIRLPALFASIPVYNMWGVERSRSGFVMRGEWFYGGCRLIPLI